MLRILVQGGFFRYVSYFGCLKSFRVKSVGTIKQGLGLRRLQICAQSSGMQDREKESRKASRISRASRLCIFEVRSQALRGVRVRFLHQAHARLQ